MVKSVETTKEIETHLTASGRMKKRQVIINNFIGGLAWGVGTVLGATVIISILFGILRGVDFFIPGFSQFIDQAEEQRAPKSRTK
jgi:hypothetical protein